MAFYCVFRAGVTAVASSESIVVGTCGQEAGVPPFDSGSFSFSAHFPASVRMSGLPSASGLVVLLVTVDAIGNMNPSPTAVPFVTLDGKLLVHRHRHSALESDTNTA